MRVAGEVNRRAYRPIPWRTERKQLRKALERIERTRDDATVLAGVAMDLLGLACDLLGERTGRDRAQVLAVLMQAKGRTLD